MSTVLTIGWECNSTICLFPCYLDEDKFIQVPKASVPVKAILVPEIESLKHTKHASWDHAARRWKGELIASVFHVPDSVLEAGIEG